MGNPWELVLLGLTTAQPEEPQEESESPPPVQEESGVDKPAAPQRRARKAKQKQEQ